jgi:hypothetical protein
MDTMITYVKDEGSNLNTLAINIIFNGHMCHFSTWTTFFKFLFWPCNVKKCQYTTNDTKFSIGMKMLLKNEQFFLQKTITLIKKSNKGRRVWYNIHRGRTSHLETQDLCENLICKQSCLLFKNFGSYRHLLSKAIYSFAS